MPKNSTRRVRPVTRDPWKRGMGTRDSGGAQKRVAQVRKCCREMSYLNTVRDDCAACRSIRQRHGWVHQL